MLWIFPMAGRGTRTLELGEFKPFIDINGKKMIEWMLLSIKFKIKESDRLIFISTKEQNEKYSVHLKIQQILENNGITAAFKLMTPDTPQKGPAHTVYFAKEDILAYPGPVIIVNSDQYIDFDLPLEIAPNTGFLPIYAEFTQKASYVDIDSQGIISRIVEKDNISNLASAGVYCVSSGEDLIWAIEQDFFFRNTKNGEYYVGPALNNLIRKGYSFFPSLVRIKFDLGNPKNIEEFKEHIKNFSK